MSRALPLYRLPLVLAVALTLTGGAACKGSKGAHPKPSSAFDACRKALDAAPEKPKAADLRPIMVACSKLFSVPACRRAWSKLEPGQMVSWFAGHFGCLCAYCPVVARKDLLYCMRYCPAKKPLTFKERVEALPAARQMWEEARHYEYGTRCGHHQQAEELLMRIFAMNIPLLLTPIDEPSRPPPPRRVKPPLGLAVVITDKGFYLKSRHGSECPEGTPADAKLCFPKMAGKYTGAVLEALQHHLWYLFASKYKDPSSYALLDERHSVTLIPEPTVKYDTIVRTMDIIREIPRNARNPPVKHEIPACGCMMEVDPKTTHWEFVTQGGQSVRDTACMYYRITLALGSS